ncbi:MAG: UDP-3-O-(3-hydroxymyristoyl)glucosamine N-acyltransferase [Pseudomonadales bacterium]
MPSFTLAELAEKLGAELQGDGTSLISGLGSIEHAACGQLCFIAKPALVKHLDSTLAAAVIISPALADGCTLPALVITNPYLAYAQVSQLFNDRPVPEPGRHSSASIDIGAIVPDSVSVAANAVIEAGAVLGENVIVGAGAYVGHDVVIGDSSRLFANVSLYHRVVVGRDCEIHSGTVIGSDGFGFAPVSLGKWQPIAQMGRVVIGDRVSIGANTAIDRGAIEDTQIGNDVIIDNLVHIAHNVIIGDGCAIAGCVGMAGSTEVGANCIMAGKVSIAGHLHIAAGTTLMGGVGVTKSITEPGSYSSGTPMMKTDEWRRAAVRFSQLDDMAKRLKALEKVLQDKDSDNTH